MPDEFVIDERPETICAVRRPERPSTAAGTPAGPTVGEGDLLTAIGDLLVEQVRLEQHARFLESGEGKDDEISKFVRQSLPFLDNFWRLLELGRENPPSDEVKNWLKNFESLYYRLVKLFESYGFVFINTVGQEVNLDCQEVVEYRPTKEHPHNYVIKEMERGIVFRNRLIRDAKVVVAYNP